MDDYRIVKLVNGTYQVQRLDGKERLGVYWNPRIMTYGISNSDYLANMNGFSVENEALEFLNQVQILEKGREVDRVILTTVQPTPKPVVEEKNLVRALFFGK